MTPTPDKRNKLIAGLCSLSFFLMIALGWLLAARGVRGWLPLEPNERAREAAVAQLLARNPGVLDSFPDANVGRTLAPWLRGVKLGETSVSSNRFGLRERDFEVPKPEGLVRVVLLGDSYVFGLGAEAEDRFGVFLEQELRRRRQSELEVEVLHVGVGSWNTRAECAFLLGNLTSFSPDLVVQVFVENDLDDNFGVRGFGVFSDFDPAHPERGDSLVLRNFSVQEQGGEQYNLLLWDADHESASRYELASEWVGRLAAGLERIGSKLVFFSTISGDLGRRVYDRFEPVVGAGRFLFLSWEFMSDAENQVGPGDMHWNRVGNERVAQLLYGMIQERGLLPELELAPWEDASRALRSVHDPVAREMTAPRSGGPPRVPRALSDPIQYYGGISSEKLVSPYASCVLDPRGTRELVLRGSFPGRLELDGGTVRVFVEDAEVGRLTMIAGDTIDRRFALPPELTRRSHAAVRFVSDRWALTGRLGRDCVCFALEHLAFE